MSAEVLKKCWWGYLAVLVYRLGGVAGATRRIVFAWPGEFTCAQIENSLRQLYPGLKPGNTQVADVIEWLRRRQIIECISAEGEERCFRRCERRLFDLQPAPTNQLTFCLE